MIFWICLFLAHRTLFICIKCMLTGCIFRHWLPLMLWHFACHYLRMPFACASFPCAGISLCLCPAAICAGCLNLTKTLWVICRIGLIIDFPIGLVFGIFIGMPKGWRYWIAVCILIHNRGIVRIFRMAHGAGAACLLRLRTGCWNGTFHKRMLSRCIYIFCI